MSSSALVWLNGKITPPEQATVSVFDRGFLFGDGVYETGRTYERCPLFLEEHLARLRRSAEKLLIPVPWSDGELRVGLFSVLKEFGQANAYYRTIVTRGTIDHVGLDVGVKTTPTLVHLVQALPKNLESVRKEGVTVLTSRIVRNSVSAQDPNIKTSNYLNSLLALQDVRSRGGDDAILCDPSGHVTEGTTFSVFGVQDNNELITPSLGVGILDSITRRHVIEVARPQFQVREGFFSLPIFQSCREVFIASSVREIVPVRNWDGNAYPAPGPVTERLQRDLRSLIDDYVKAHPKY